MRNNAASSALLNELAVPAHPAATPMHACPTPVTTNGAQLPGFEQGLLRLVDDMDTLRVAWEREPLVTTGIGSFTDIISTAAVQRILQSGLPISAIQLFNNGVKLPTDELVRPVTAGARGRHPVADLVKISEAVARGATLCLHEMHTFSPEVADFAALVAQQTGYQVGGWVFLTPAHSRGADPHADSSSIFMCQVEGSKRWRISRPLKSRPGKRWRPADGAVEILDVLLREGDCLYMPRGFVHVGEAGDEASVHLSLSLDTPSWAMVLEQALTVAASGSEVLGQLPPPLFDQGADRRALFEQRRELLNRIVDGLRYSDIAPAPAGDASYPRTATDTLADALFGRSGERSG